MALEFVSEVLLPRLLAAGVQSTLFVAVIWALCKLLPRLSASARARLWWLVALQLVVGLLWSSPLALPLLPAEAAHQIGTASMPMDALSPAHAQVLASPSADISPYLSLTEASSWSWTDALAWMWLLGLSLMIARTLGGYLATRRMLRESLACKDRNLLHALQLAAEAHGLRRAPHLRLSSSIDSPQLIGPLRPVLLLPANHVQSMHADELDMALTHELIHLQRGDLWWGLLPATAQHLFFFHPLAHLAAHEYALAREAACDAAVLAGNRHCARDYGRLLVRLGVAPRPSAGLASASPTFRILKRRLVMLQNTASTPRAVALVITLAVAILGVMPYRIVAAPAQEAAVAPTPAAAAAPSVAPVAAVAATATATAAVAPVAAAAPFNPIGIVVPPSPPAAPEPPAPAPPVPPVPAAAIPAPPAPPAPLTTRGTYTYVNDGDQAYVMLKGNETFAMGSSDDMRQAQQQRRGNEEILWLRKGNARYVVRDPATLSKLSSLHEEMSAVGEQQGRLGEQQGKLGEEQGRLGARQAEIAARAASIAAESAANAAAGDAGHAQARAHAAQSERMAALDAQQRSMSEQMESLAKRQEALGREQAALGAKQAAASERASKEAARLVDQAIRSGAAQPVKQ